MPPILFPGHRYLGPGNPIDNGDPVDEDDRIAQRHDIAYEDDRTRENFRRADRVAISDFSRDFVRTGNWHSAAGATGLELNTRRKRSLVFNILDWAREEAITR